MTKNTKFSTLDQALLDATGPATPARPGAVTEAQPVAWLAFEDVEYVETFFDHSDALKWCDGDTLRPRTLTSVYSMPSVAPVAREDELREAFVSGAMFKVQNPSASADKIVKASRAHAAARTTPTPPSAAASPEPGAESLGRDLMRGAPMDAIGPIRLNNPAPRADARPIGVIAYDERPDGTPSHGLFYGIADSYPTTYYRHQWIPVYLAPRADATACERCVERDTLIRELRSTNASAQRALAYYRADATAGGVDINTPMPEHFREYVERNYPPGVVIGNPAWHAPKLWGAALYALRAAQPETSGGAS